jgi:predicted transcriptional regulator
MDTTSLGSLEQRVMSHLWHVGPATVGEVRDALNAAATRQLAYTTVMTILVRLDEKGYVSRTREGRLFRYTAAFAEDDLAAEIGRRDLRRLIERHGAATLAGFAADLVGPGSDLAARLHAIADKSKES